MALDQDFLCALSEAPGVATACGPVYNCVRRWLHRRCHLHFCPDSHALITFRGVLPRDLRMLFVAHVDEIGGVVLGRQADGPYRTRWWGGTPEVFAGATLQAMDYLCGDGSQSVPVEGFVEEIGGQPELFVQGGELKPYRTVWTFREAAAISGDRVEGKALDPRATVFAVLTAFMELGDTAVGVLLVMAEECAMGLAGKAVLQLQRTAPNLQLIVNADVPHVKNVEDGRLDVPAIRIFEGRNMVDPGFGIDMAERLTARGVPFQLTASLTGSQTPLFAPLAPCVSVALPGENIHTARARMSLTGIQRCVDLLCAIVRSMPVHSDKHDYWQGC